MFCTAAGAAIALASQEPEWAFYFLKRTKQFMTNA